MRKALVLIFSMIFISGCQPSVQEQKADLRKYFERNKIGRSIDYAVMKKTSKYDEDFMISVHGFLDDKNICENTAEMLNNMEGSNAFSCKQLNTDK